jgi:hypothetical protein
VENTINILLNLNNNMICQKQILLNRRSCHPSSNNLFHFLQNRGNERDLTLAPNPDIAFILQLYKDDPEKTEKLLGEAYARRLHTSGGK